MRLILTLLIAISAWAADTTLYVNTDTGSGTTCSLASPCASLSVAEAQIPANITAAGSDGIWTIEVSGAAADTTPVEFHGTTTDATHYIVVRPAAAYRHAGVWSESKYRIVTVDSTPITITTGHVRLDGLQVSLSSQTTTRNIIFSTSADVVHLSNLILKGDTASHVTRGVYSTAGTVNIWNVIAYSMGNTNSAAVQVNGGTVNVYSSTLVAGGYGIFRQNGTVAAKNVYAKGYDGYAFSGTITTTTCASADTTGDIDNIAFSTTNFTNVTAGSENFQLVSGSGLLTTGTNTSGDSAPLNFTTDIAGNARGASWDIGAFQLTAGATAVRHRRMEIQ